MKSKLFNLRKLTLVFGMVTIFLSTGLSYASSKESLASGGCFDDARYWDDDKCPAAKDHCCGK